MSSIYDIAGTTSDSFSLNGKCTILQGSGKPENYIGKPGDIYLSDTGALYVKGVKLNESTGEIEDGGWKDLVETALPAPNKQGSFPYVSGESYTLSEKSVNDIAFKDDSSYEWLKENIIKTVSGRNIGDIFYTTRLDAELNGAVECNGGEYDIGDFEGEQSIGKLLENGQLPYVSFAEYNSMIVTNNSCGFFGWDGGNKFKVPTIPALLLNKTPAEVVGNGMTIGLTNGTDNYGMVYANYNDHKFAGLQGHVGAYGDPQGTYLSTNTSISNTSIGLTPDGSKSGIIANLDVTEYRAMVQLITGASDEAILTATTAISQLADVMYKSKDDNITGQKIFEKETIFKKGNSDDGQVRIISSDGKRGIILRADDSSLYFLLTNENDANGSYNDLRPLKMDYNGNVWVKTPANDSKSSVVATTEWVKNKTYLNLSNRVTLSVSLNKAFTITNDGFLVLSIEVGSQSDSKVQIHMTNSGTASTSTATVCSIAHNGGAAERNTIPVVLPVKKNQSVYLDWNGAGNATVKLAYLFVHA